MMRFAVGSIAATLLLAAAMLCTCTEGSAALGATIAQAQAAANQAPAAPQAASAEQANDQAQAKLRKPINIDCPGEPLLYAVSDVANSAGVQVYFDVAAIEEAEIDLMQPAVIILDDVPAEMILRLLLSQKGLAYKLDHGVVVATTPAALAGELDIRVYGISDLVQPDEQTEAEETASEDDEDDTNPADQAVLGLPEESHTAGLEPSHLDELIDLIISTVEPKTWNRMGGPATIGEYRGTLVISQTADGHDKVKEMLQGLRAALTGK
jgi:general secretion pathway protein D